MFELISEMYDTNIIFNYYMNFFVIVIGLVIGSFLNVVALRCIANESIVFPASHCPKCKTPLKWYDNIPVLSYIFLLGKCRSCKKPISIQYPIVETITGIIFLLIFLKTGFSLTTLMLWILFGCGIVMCITDFKEQVIFDALSIPLIPVGLVYSFFNLGHQSTQYIPVFNLGFNVSQTFTDGIIGTVLAFLIFEIISLISKLTIKQRAFGEGDTIIAMIFGAWFGWKIMILTSLLAVIVQSVFTLPILIFKLIKSKDKIAITAFSILLLSAIIPFAINALLPIDNPTISLLFIAVILSIAVISSMFFLRRMRELNAFTFLPFGPALIVAGFISSMYLISYIPTLLN